MSGSEERIAGAIDRVVNRLREQCEDSMGRGSGGDWLNAGALAVVGAALEDLAAEIRG